VRPENRAAGPKKRSSKKKNLQGTGDKGQQVRSFEAHSFSEEAQYRPVKISEVFLS